MKEKESYLDQSKQRFFSVLKGHFEEGNVEFKEVCLEAKGLVLENTDKLDGWEFSDKDFFSVIFGLEGTANLFGNKDEKSVQAIKSAEERVRAYYEAHKL